MVTVFNVLVGLNDYDPSVANQNLKGHIKSFSNFHLSTGQGGHALELGQLKTSVLKLNRIVALDDTLETLSKHPIEIQVVRRQESEIKSRPRRARLVSRHFWSSLLSAMSKAEGVAMLAPRQHVEQMGRPFQLEEFEYVLTSIERHTTIGRGFHQREATEGATWVVVHYTIENTGKETENALTGDLTLKDTQGRTFQPSREGTTAVSLTKKVDIALTQLQPGLKKRQVAVFEVPTAVSKHFELVVPEKGLLGRKSRSFPFAWLSRRSA